MPDYFTHLIIAEKIYDRLPNSVRSRIVPHERYLLGSQGGDLFFFYKATPTSANIGRKLHLMSAENVFSALLKGDFTYCAGYATHYALDCTLHPDVYAYSEARYGIITHQSFEEDLGLFASRRYNLMRQILTLEDMLECVYPVYTSMRLVEPNLSLSGVERCIKRFFTYTKHLYDRKKNIFRNDFPYSSLYLKLEQAISLGVKAIISLSEGKVDKTVFSKSFLER